MGKRSVRENKNIYQLAREAAGLTREAASEKMIFVSDDRIEKIESGRSMPHPDEIIAMSECYRYPKLLNLFCTSACPIGAKTQEEIPEEDLGHIVLALLNDLNHLDKQKNRLIEIASDGIVHPDEEDDLDAIRNLLQKIALRADMLNLWMQNDALKDMEETV